MVFMPGDKFQPKILGTKLIHMTLIGTLVFILGSVLSINIDRLVETTTTKLGDDPKDLDKISTRRLIASCILSVGLIYAAHYGIRNILDIFNYYAIPYILFWGDSIGYDQNHLKSLGGGVMVAFSILNFNETFKNKAKYLFLERLKKRNLSF